MGAADEWPPAEELLREHPAGRDVGRLAGRVRDLLRDQRWSGLRISGRRKYVERDRAEPPAGVVGRGPDPAMIRVVLPFHLQRLAKVGREVSLEVEGEVTQRSVLDALEARYPVL